MFPCLFVLCSLATSIIIYRSSMESSSTMHVRSSTVPAIFFKPGVKFFVAFPGLQILHGKFY